MKNIIKSFLIIVAVAAVAGGATYSYFSDTETSTGNTFTAGTLDLDVDGNNGVNTVKFTVANMRPGNQPTGQFRLHNSGSLSGYLDLENISVTSEENGCNEPEIGAGDTTCSPSTGNGELQNVVNMRLYWDNDCNGSYSTGDVQIYSGMTGSVASSYDTNKSIAAGGTQCLMAVYDWWNTSSDNLAQGDGMTVNFGFELGQDASQ